MDRLARSGYRGSLCQARATMSRLPIFATPGATTAGATSTGRHQQPPGRDGKPLKTLKERSIVSTDARHSKAIGWHCDPAPSVVSCKANSGFTKRMRKRLAQRADVMSNPVDRQVSQYIHRWSPGEICCNAKRLAPVAETWRPAILPVFFECLILDQQGVDCRHFRDVMCGHAHTGH